MKNSMNDDVHFFFFQPEISCFGKFIFKKSKLFVDAETWNLD